MCGIAGCFAADIAPATMSTVGSMIHELRARGPDHSDMQHVQSARGAAALFGHNRLSIIDLSADGNQPMWDQTGRLCIIYNGEIYNYIEVQRELATLGHTFATASDTEVILEAFREWGVDCLDRLNGMFAFALFDVSTGAVWLARDRFGVKPLYYVLDGSRILFSSTPGPLARQLSLRPNLSYLARGVSYLLYEDDGPISQYEGVSAIPSGHYARGTISSDGSVELLVRRWYDLGSRVETAREAIATASEADLLGMLSETIDSAVSMRLRADVAVSLALSGGLDSSSIAAIAAERIDGIRAFSFAHPEIATSEGPLAARTVAKSGISVEFVWPHIRDRVDGFFETLAAQDAPFTDLSIVAQYLVCKAAHASGMKVLLGGQGADEMLMGYRKFQVMALGDAIRRRDRREILHFAASVLPMLAAEAPRATMYFRQRHRYTRAEGLSGRLRLPVAAPLALAQGVEPIWMRQLRDVTQLSLPTLLRYEDRNSMANSLETRLPFMDYRLAELALALPSWMKIKRGMGKWPLREVMKDRIPEAIRVAKYKRGFDMAQQEWMGAGLGAAIRDRIRLNMPTLSAWVPAGYSIDELFSDRRLAVEPMAMAEATTLLWLADRQ